MNWNGTFLRETLARHDEVNSSIDVLLNFGGFMYIGAILPWSDFHAPDTTGITIGRLLALGLLVLLLRRIPAMLCAYKLMPSTVTSWKEALFMGYFGPIGIGAVFYVEHARHLFPALSAAETHEEEDLLRAMGPVVYFLVLFSIVVHGLSIPLLDLIYRRLGVLPIVELAPAVERRRSVAEALPPNSHLDPRCGSVVRHNRFSRVVSRDDGVADEEAVAQLDRPLSTSRSRRGPDTPPAWRLTGDSEGSTVYGKEEVWKEGEEAPRIRFQDERAARAEREGEVGAVVSALQAALRR